MNYDRRDDGPEYIRRRYVEPFHSHDDRVIGKQTINCYKGGREDVISDLYYNVPPGNKKTIVIIFILIILLTIALSLVVWDLYREGSTAFLSRGLGNAAKRNISIPNIQTT